MSKKDFYRSLKYSVIIGGLSPLLFASNVFASGCGNTFEAGRSSFELTSGGQTRTVVYFVPSNYSGHQKVPAVLDFHGSTSTADEQMDRSEWERVAEREGFIAVALQGAIPSTKPGTFSWNIPGVTKGDGPDDIRFINDAITALSERFCIDETKVYGTGYSGGARLLSQYICNGETGFAAAGFVAGLRAGYPKDDNGKWHPDAATCTPKATLSFIAFAGAKDAINPYDGGGRPYWQYGAQAALDRWVQLNGCTAKPTIENKGQLTLSQYDDCKEGARIASYVIADAGHTWPSSTAMLRIQNIVGKVSHEVNATDEIWSFFKATEN
ncbi:polyhydroxybutyrate depolymerase [Agrobacterium larrymoorei]|uniref:alpha/beta hydrolase family esterase n=1 Tax=Agrobacterium larrymoorei TaxID=160699 RepID=UPI001573030B|nr:polyhydroxybutyrate depolymerase [Agrobacterium larrymoorei]NTJ43374.1 polyhydroxybutyrate depolymerase [Agrobacterium larrymoorei]